MIGEYSRFRAAEQQTFPYPGLDRGIIMTAVTTEIQAMGDGARKKCCMLDFDRLLAKNFLVMNSIKNECEIAEQRWRSCLSNSRPSKKLPSRSLSPYLPLRI
jgi:hypothetical protein